MVEGKGKAISLAPVSPQAFLFLTPIHSGKAAVRIATSQPGMKDGIGEVSAVASCNLLFVHAEREMSRYFSERN